MQSKGFCDFSCEHVFNLIPVQLMLQPYKLLGYQKKSMLFEGFKPLHVMFFCPKKKSPSSFFKKSVMVSSH